ncbi:MAG: NADH-quinone oxidoreductase subunit NuoK [Thermoplasmata archaeon]|jgi:NADH-quinone oxidoreductase subunit K
MTTLPVGDLVALASGLVAISIFGILTRRNFILLLIALEIGMNAAILTFVYFAAFPQCVTAATCHPLTGQAIAVVVIGLAATEVAVGLAIVLALHRIRGTTNVAEATTLQL